MITSLYVYSTPCTDPYQNLAVEEYLTFHMQPGECILYLWQNRHTVVIGKNQNCWKECNVELLEAEGGHLARRLSGGGAVYHDLGNLNFTFCVRKSDADVARQMDVILQAVRLLGINAEKTGRNDIAVDGRKFSGNAFLESGDFYYHHGTVMLDVNAEALGRYLNVSKAKLAAKGVASVRARTVNLTSLAPALTVEKMADCLKKAASEVYGLPAQLLPENRIDDKAVEQLRQKLTSKDWLYGRKLPFTSRIEGRWPWGGVELELAVEGGKVREARVYSDALQANWFEHAGDGLTGCAYRSDEIIRRLDETLAQRGADSAVREDVCAWIASQLAGETQDKTEDSDG